MFDRKLKALDYHLVNEFDIKDSNKCRQLIAWLEDQKIRHYKIEERYALRDVTSRDWDQAFHQYMSDIDCPYDQNQLKFSLDWILTLALRLEYEDNLEKYNDLNVEDIRREPQMVQNNPIDNLDFESKEFKEGVNQLAKLVEVPTHPTDHLITLRAIALVIRKCISMESKDRSDQKNKQMSNTRIEDKSMSLKASKDPVLNNSAKLLRLLYINDLRELQTNINEIIAAIQSITANPKTDTALGMVGS